MNPIVDYLGILSKYRVQPRYYPRAVMYLAKALAFEPFRYGERVMTALRNEPRELPHAPLFILGYYRSGTTHLQETLLRDPQFGYMNFYQGFFPAAFTSTERWLKPVFERIVRRVGLIHPAHDIPFSFVLPAEEDVSMVASGSRLAANWGQVFPRSFKEIYAKTGLLEGISPEDRRELEHQLRDLYFRVSEANGHKKLLLKSPPQLGRLAMLLDMYPDAKFVFIRRDPYDVFASNKKLWRSFQKTWMQDVDDATAREYILWSFDRCHAAYERDKPRVPAGQLCEITFEDFRAGALTTLERIYDTLALGDFSKVQPRFASYLAERHQHAQPPYELTTEERCAIETRLARWLARDVQRPAA